MRTAGLRDVTGSAAGHRTRQRPPLRPSLRGSLPGSYRNFSGCVLGQVWVPSPAGAHAALREQGATLGRPCPLRPFRKPRPRLHTQQASGSCRLPYDSKEEDKPETLVIFAAAEKPCGKFRDHYCLALGHIIGCHLQQICKLPLIRFSEAKKAKYAFPEDMPTTGRR